MGLRDGVFIWNAVIGFLLVAIYQVLNLVYEIDNNIFFANQLMYATQQAIFSAIGRLPYYPEVAEQKGILRTIKRPYRIGRAETDKNGNRCIEVIK